MATTPSTAPEYVLGTGDDELSRLAFQHRLWADAAHAAWRSARIRAGARVLDVGCGPGAATLDLGELVGPTGAILGVDESAPFIQHLNAQAAVRGLRHARGVTGDVMSLQTCAGVDADFFDAAYARWVLCFVPRPGDVVVGVARALKPGGRFVVHDYFNYEAMKVAPRGTPFADLYEKIVRATGESWRGRGGDPDIVGRLPTLMRAAGFVNISIAPLQRMAFPRDTMFQWVGSWWRNYVPKLATMNLITTGERDEFIAGWEAFARSPDSWALMPCVFEVIGEKGAR
ncbi:methyltransferase domain-containing protein [soil metagenome]